MNKNIKFFVLVIKINAYWKKQDKIQCKYYKGKSWWGENTVKRRD